MSSLLPRAAAEVSARLDFIGLCTRVVTGLQERTGKSTSFAIPPWKSDRPGKQAVVSFGQASLRLSLLAEGIRVEIIGSFGDLIEWDDLASADEVIAFICGEPCSA